MTFIRLQLLIILTSVFFVSQAFAGTYSLPSLKGQIHNYSSNNLQEATVEIKLICIWYGMFNSHECGKQIVSAPLDANNNFQLPAIDFKFNSGFHKSHIWLQIYVVDAQRNHVWSLYNLVMDQSDELRIKNSYQQYGQISFVDLPGDTLHFSQNNNAEWNCRTNIDQIPFPYNVKINLVALDSANKSLSRASEISVLVKNGKDETSKVGKTLLFVGGDISEATKFVAEEQIVQGEGVPSAVYYTKSFSANNLTDLWGDLSEVSCRP